MIAPGGWLAAMGPGAALPVVLMKDEGACSSPGGRLAKNNAGSEGRILPCICFYFKLGKNWLFSSGWTNLSKEIYILKKYYICIKYLETL